MDESSGEGGNKLTPDQMKSYVVAEKPVVTRRGFLKGLAAALGFGAAAVATGEAAKSIASQPQPGDQAAMQSQQDVELRNAQQQTAPVTPPQTVAQK